MTGDRWSLQMRTLLVCHLIKVGRKCKNLRYSIKCIVFRYSHTLKKSQNGDTLGPVELIGRPGRPYHIVTDFIGIRSWHDKSLNHTGERPPPRSGGKPPGPSRLLRTSTIYLDFFIFSANYRHNIILAFSERPSDCNQWELMVENRRLRCSLTWNGL